MTDLVAPPLSAMDTQRTRNRTRPLILVIEDTEADRQMICRVLKKAGYLCHSCEDAQAALDYLCTHAEPDLILLDLVLPGMSGWEFLRDWRAAFPTAKIPLIVTSAYTDPRIAADLLQANGFLPKPFRPETLLSVVAECLGTNGEDTQASE